jgi:hypothetical protein
VFKICSKSAQNLLKIYSKFAQNLLKICSKFAQNLLKICSNFAQTLLKICSNFSSTYFQYWAWKRFPLGDVFKQAFRTLHWTPMDDVIKLFFRQWCSGTISQSLYPLDAISVKSNSWKLGVVFAPLHFLCNLQMGQIRQCYITIGCKGLRGTNTLACWAHL